MLSARPWQESRGDREHREDRRDMGRKMVQALKCGARWDMSDSRCCSSLELFLQVVALGGTTAPEN